MKYEVIELDVWGNETGGFDVNQAFYTNHYLKIDETATDEEIINILKKELILSDCANIKTVEIDQNHYEVIYVTAIKNSMPLYNLQLIED